MQYTNDGGVYYNTVTTSPDCHDPIWERRTVTVGVIVGVDGELGRVEMADTG